MRQDFTSIGFGEEFSEMADLPEIEVEELDFEEYICDEDYDIHGMLDRIDGRAR